jgi:hypothetical protein
MRARKRQAPLTDLSLTEVADASGTLRSETPPRREAVLSELLEFARSVLAEGPPGQSAMIAACVGSPLCDVRNPTVSYAATCPLCECIELTEDGIVTHKRAARA